MKNLQLPDTLTDLAVKGLKPNPVARYEVFDAKLRGFGVRVAPSGMKSFVLFYRSKGRLRRLTLGRYPVLSLGEARRLALAALNEVNHGNDPQREKIEARDRATFEAMVATFLSTHCARYNRASTAAETARVLKTHFVPRWGTRDPREITRNDVLTTLDRIVRNGAPSAANHAQAAVRKLFNWGVERGIVEVTPCAGIKAPTPKRSRDRVLGDDELVNVWRAAVSDGYPFGTIVQLLILTAQRRGEVTEMRWAELDLSRATWTIPADRTKSNRVQHLPLVPEVVQILASIPQLDQDRVFPAQGGSDRSFSGFSKAKRRLSRRAEADDWSLHDLRRTAATGMARLGVAPHVIERILNHTTGTLGGVAGVFNRFGYLPEMRNALGRWTDHVCAVAAHDNSRVGESAMPHTE